MSNFQNKKNIITWCLLIIVSAFFLISCGSYKPETDPKIMMRIIIERKVFSRSPIDEQTINTITIQCFIGGVKEYEFTFPFTDHEAEITAVPEGTYTVKGIAKDKDGNALLEGKVDNVVLKNGETTEVELVLKEIETEKEEKTLPFQTEKCPNNRVVDMDTYYIDKYEASRPNATSSSTGSDNSEACTQANVLPWAGINWNDAKAACVARGTGWGLCSASEWGDACDGIIGEGGNTYPYGDDYQGSTCNGYDAGNGKAMPTGDMSGCTSDDGVYDMSGNVWEWTDEQLGDFRVLRGGSWSDSSSGLACSNSGSRDPARTGSSVGFRCCQDK